MRKTEDYRPLANVVEGLDALEEMMTLKDNGCLECKLEAFRVTMRVMRKSLSDVHMLSTDELSEAINVLQRMDMNGDDRSKNYAGVIRDIIMPVVSLFVDVTMLLDGRRRGIDTPYRTFKQNATQDAKSTEDHADIGVNG